MLVMEGHEHGEEHGEEAKYIAAYYKMVKCHVSNTAHRHCLKFEKLL